MKKRQKYIAVVAGGSGGHLIPALEVAQHWVKEHSDYEIMLFTTTKKIDTTIIQQYPSITSVIKLSIPTVSLRRFWAMPDIIIKTLFAFVKSYYLLAKTTPVNLISTGGFVSIPVCFAAKLVRTPIDVYELNAVPGKAIKFLSKLATRIIVAFERSKQFFPAAQTTFQQYPVRFSMKDIVLDRATLIDTITGFDQERKTIFLLGGSQGSVQLNHKLKDFLLMHPENHNKVQIIHQTGVRDQFDWVSFYRERNIPAVVFSYTHQIAMYYQVADVVITRAGAGTLFELLFFNKKSLIIPLITNTSDHQKDNANAMVQAYPGLFSMLEHKDIERQPEIFYRRLSDLIR